MKWINHIAIATAISAAVDPVLVPGAALGATAPDWLEWIIAPFHNVKHRGVTHYLVTWASAVFFFSLIWDFRSIGLAFSVGGLFHILTDAMTISGVPMGPWSDRKFYLFGGKLKTGQPGEYMCSGVVIMICAIFVMNKPNSASFIPFFYNWGGLYEEGIIDANEWKTNRFKFI